MATLSPTTSSTAARTRPQRYRGSRATTSATRTWPACSATGGSDTYACGFVSAKYGLAKAGVIVAGFDLFPQTLGYIKSGDMTFTIDQQAYLQGFVPVQQMYL